MLTTHICNQASCRFQQDYKQSQLEGITSELGRQRPDIPQLPIPHCSATHWSGEESYRTRHKIWTWKWENESSCLQSHEILSRWRGQVIHDRLWSFLQNSHFKTNMVHLVKCTFTAWEAIGLQFSGWCVSIPRLKLCCCALHAFPVGHWRRQPVRAHSKVQAPMATIFSTKDSLPLNLQSISTIHLQSSPSFRATCRACSICRSRPAPYTNCHINQDAVLKKHLQHVRCVLGLKPEHRADVFLQRHVWIVRHCVLGFKSETLKRRAGVFLRGHVVWIVPVTVKMARGRKADRITDPSKQKKRRADAQEEIHVRPERAANPFLRSWAWKREHRYSSSPFPLFLANLSVMSSAECRFRV